MGFCHCHRARQLSGQGACRCLSVLARSIQYAALPLRQSGPENLLNRQRNRGKASVDAKFEALRAEFREDGKRGGCLKAETVE